MNFELWMTISVVVSVLLLLMLTNLGADMVMVGGVTLLMVADIISVEEALSGLANQGMATVGILFVVVAGTRQTGGMEWIVKHILGMPKSELMAQTKVMLPVTVFSAFVNNTPIVAMMIPAISEWSKKIKVSPSKLLIPLSYASIFGGICTLIGTSTNLIVNGLAIQAGMAPLQMFDIAWIGVPCAIAGVIYLLLVGRWLLPHRASFAKVVENPREYTVEMLVPKNSPLVGQSIEEAGLRHLPGVYLVEIIRNNEVIGAAAPDQKLNSEDRLVFVGIVDSVSELLKTRGLMPSTDQIFKLDAPRSKRCLIEAVISPRCPLVGKTVRKGKFRVVYGAAIIAITRDGQRLRQRIGDVVLKGGDTLLLETVPQFIEEHKNKRDFFLVSKLEGSTPLRHDRALISLGILVAMVVVVTVGWLSMIKASMLAAGAMLITRCCSASDARRSVDWEILMVIAAAFGISQAVVNTGLAQILVELLLDGIGNNPRLALTVVYGVTMVLTAAITNNATAVLMFPITLDVAKSLDVNPMGFIIALMIAASASFASPLGYQTNLMVYGPGGYKFTDFLKIGVPLNLLLGLISIILIPWIWPF